MIFLKIRSNEMTKNTNDQDYIVELSRENNDLKRWNETLKSIAKEDKKIIDSLREKNNILANSVPYPNGGGMK
jgi:hypothetical protein